MLSMTDGAPEERRQSMLWHIIGVGTAAGLILYAVIGTPAFHRDWYENILNTAFTPEARDDLNSYSVANLWKNVRNYFEYTALRRDIVINDIESNLYPVPVLQADDIPLERPSFPRDVPDASVITHSQVVPHTEVHDPHEGEWHLSQIAHVTSGVPTETELASLQAFLVQHDVSVSDEEARAYFAKGSYSAHGTEHSLWRSSYRDTEVVDKDGVVLSAFFTTLKS